MSIFIVQQYILVGKSQFFQSCSNMAFWLLWEKTTSWACLVTSGLNDIFHWYAWLEILIKSSFSCKDDRLVSWTTEKIEVTSAKSSVVNDRFLARSLIYTKNVRGPKIDLWSMPASAGNHEDDWPFNKTL